MLGGKLFRLGVAVLTVGGLLFSAPGEAHALLNGGGTAVVNCTARFPVIPGNNNSGTCDGTAIVTAAVLSGSVLLAEAGPFYAQFVYSEPCLATGQPDIVLSFAVGQFQVYLPSATIRGTFSWSRVGLNPVIVLNDVVFTFSGGSTTSPGSGVGTASFIPPGTFNPSTELLCGQGGGPLDIGVAIAAALAA